MQYPLKEEKEKNERKPEVKSNLGLIPIPITVHNLKSPVSETTQYVKAI